ncbi:hypothetical protein [Micromonospora sp. NPDC023737]|uniref:hypothetical protein n=1 Tax=unclassified Micromonospora TaxID=2617518 RepID=UPI003405C0D1
MDRLTRPDARTLAVVTAVAALSLLVTLIVWRRQDLVGVVLALLCVLFAIVAGVSVAAARQSDDETTVETPPATPSLPEPLGIDADTLDALDSRDALRAVRDRRRGLDDG